MSPEALPEAVLQLRNTLPLKPAPVTLQGKYVYLKPLDISQDGADLYKITNGEPITVGDFSYPAYNADEKIWAYMNWGPFESFDDFCTQLAQPIKGADILPFCVYDTKSDQRIGSASLMSNVPAHLKIEIGGIWYSPIAQGTFANTEATYLILDHAFSLGYRRLEWKCNALNIRSRRAAERIGFTFEGIQEAHYIVKGHNRDTAWFRILDHEWAEIKQRLEKTLYPNDVE